ncbi:hypothetical protein CHS0354_034546 [Potamilus streckersoni]|uniref:GH10 domain-containing protein n=1 Tax=Potamilus streckersoni TaxID=2493646 RepID=A0AAE0SVM4_9BIVA|nr:hypothetical protein CHS0354_034546 [Potamilus streckersoni]
MAVKPGMGFNIVLIVGVAVVAAAAPNLLQNPDFESLSNWDCSTHHCELTTDKHSGQYAIKSSGRTQTWMGPSQWVTLKQNTRYEAVAFVKLLQSAQGKMFTRVSLTVEFDFDDGSKNYVPIAEQPTVWQGYWIELSGNFITPNRGIKGSRIYAEGCDTGIDFLMDSASLTEIPENTHWRAESDKVINSTQRKQTMHISVTTDAHVNSSQVLIEIIQTKNAFPFGTAVAADELLTGDGRYRDFIYQKFNWAVLENALKWQQMEGDRVIAYYRIDYDKPLRAIRELKSHGIKVRAHCVVWSVDEFNPNWLKGLYQDGLRQAVTERINGVVPKVKGLLAIILTNQDWSDVGRSALPNAFTPGFANVGLLEPYFINAVLALEASIATGAFSPHVSHNTAKIGMRRSLGRL